jgi:predicted Fe-Mo cluster-binding NifX family protein
VKLALPVWNSRVSPVFDVAGKVLLVDVLGGEPAWSEEHTFQGFDRVTSLVELGADVLICGAISVELEERLLGSGVDVVAEVRGSVEDVIRAYLVDRLAQPELSMPGCYSRRRRARCRFAPSPAEAERS